MSCHTLTCTVNIVRNIKEYTERSKVEKGIVRVDRKDQRGQSEVTGQTSLATSSDRDIGTTS